MNKTTTSSEGFRRNHTLKCIYLILDSKYLLSSVISALCLMPECVEVCDTEELNNKQASFNSH